MAPRRLTLGYIPGATPGKWARIWEQRYPDVELHLRAVAASEAAAEVRAGSLDVAVMRLPADAAGLSVIPLYEETTVAVVPADHLLSAADEIAGTDLVDEPVLVPRDHVVDWADAPGVTVDHRPESTTEAVELVAAGMGVLIVPQSLARLHHRRDLTYRPIRDAPTCRVALAVRAGPQTPDIDAFIGVVRGRKPGSSRAHSQPAPKRTAREKTLAKQAARAAAGKVARKPGRGKR